MRISRDRERKRARSASMRIEKHLKQMRRELSAEEWPDARAMARLAQDELAAIVEATELLVEWEKRRRERRGLPVPRAGRIPRGES